MLEVATETPRLSSDNGELIPTSSINPSNKRLPKCCTLNHLINVHTHLKPVIYIGHIAITPSWKPTIHRPHAVPRQITKKCRGDKIRRATTTRNPYPLGDKPNQMCGYSTLLFWVPEPPILVSNQPSDKYTWIWKGGGAF